MLYCGEYSSLEAWGKGGVSACFLSTLVAATSLTTLMLASLRLFSSKKAETLPVIANKVT